METNRSLSNNATFEKRLAFGQIAETDIARWIMSHGGVVVPVYDIEYPSGKGPRIFQIDRQWVAPDLLVFKSGELTWIEAKHKTVFTWFRKTQRWTTGIDLNHYTQYLQIQVLTQTPVWLLFLHSCSTPSAGDRQFGCPANCPVGLFGNSLDALATSESHRSKNWGRGGMVYWAHDSLKRLATIEEVQKSSKARYNSTPFA